MRIDDEANEEEIECKEFKIVTTRESNPMLLFDGYAYVLNTKKDQPPFYWICQKSPSCKYRLISNGFNPLDLFNQNNYNMIVLKTNSNINLS